VPVRRFEETAVQRLQQRQWPGNVRELRNAVERLLILAPGKTVTAGDVSRLLGDTTVSEVVEAAGAPPDGTFEAFKHEAERSFLASKLREHDWNVSETARSLKMPRSNLYKKIERYGLSRETP
jgi:two-component system nitrogen regulation response regulator NtrX